MNKVTKLVLLKAYLYFSLAFFIAAPFMLEGARAYDKRMEYEKGYSSAIDTVQSLLDKQAKKNDSIVSKTKFIKRGDTLTYIFHY